MELHHDARNVIIGLIIVVGALQCFFGYRIFKVILGLTGFLLGGVLAAAIGSTFSQEVVFVLISGLIGGFIGAVLLVGLYFVGVFIIGALFGGVLGTVLYAVAESNPDPAILLILAILTGVLALIFQKFMIIVSTAFGGASAVVAGIAYFITGAVDMSSPDHMFGSDGSYLYAMLLGWLALGTFGVIVQYHSPQIKNYQSVAAPNSEKDSEIYLQ